MVDSSLMYVDSGNGGVGSKLSMSDIERRSEMNGSLVWLIGSDGTPIVSMS